jgi:hypothetical protein
MSRPHEFHLDYGGHSITVEVSSGLKTTVELLVDGKPVGIATIHHGGDASLSGELAETPPIPVSVDVHQPKAGRGAPTCVVHIDGVERPLQERVHQH